ncbi:MAG TPA: phage portal protein [Flavobacterium sp.]|nr:phage portal protein [Flavobacterium sp.]
MVVSRQPIQSVKPPLAVVKRDSLIPDVIPEKVFIERKPEMEWSPDEPNLKNYIANLLDGYYSQSNFLELFHCLPEIFAPIHEIASRVADARWELRKTWNDEVDYTDEAFNRLFTSPNPFMNMQQHVYMSVCYYLLTGRLFWSRNLPSTLELRYSNILSWFTLPSHTVHVDQIKNVDIYTCTETEDFIRGYQLRDTVIGTKGRKFEPKEVMPVVNYSLKHAYDLNRNNSPLLGADKPIKNLIPVYEARGVIYIKRGAMGFIVSRKTDDSGTVALTPDENDQLLADYQKTYGVVGGKSNLGITGQPIDYIQIGMSIKELQPFEETLADAIAIYSTLRVPRHLVPSKDAGTFSNVDASMKAFYDNVIIPLATMFADTWTNGMYFSSNRKYVYPNFDHVNYLQADKKLEAEVDKTNTETADLRYRKGMITKNERNGMVGAQTSPDGDVYATDSNNTDPVFVKLGPEGMLALQSVLDSTVMSEPAKIIALTSFFNIDEKIAKQIVKTKENGTDIIEKENKTGTDVEDDE